MPRPRPPSPSPRRHLSLRRHAAPPQRDHGGPGSRLGRQRSVLLASDLEHGVQAPGSDPLDQPLGQHPDGQHASDPGRRVSRDHTLSSMSPSPKNPTISWREYVTAAFAAVRRRLSGMTIELEAPGAGSAPRRSPALAAIVLLSLSEPRMIRLISSATYEGTPSSLKIARQRWRNVKVAPDIAPGKTAYDPP